MICTSLSLQLERLNLVVSWLQDGAQVLVALIDMAGLWFALVSKFAHRNTSNAHKFQAVGVGMFTT